MNIKTKLSFKFALLVFAILLFFSFLVFYFSFTTQRAKFRDNLLNQAQNNAILLINVAEVDSTLLIKIQQTTKSLEEEEIAIANSKNQIIYSYRLDYLKEKNLTNLPVTLQPQFFSLGKKEGVNYTHRFNDQIYHVIVVAYNKFGEEYQQELRTFLFWCVLFGIWLAVSVSYFFSRSAMKPISRIISSVKEINSAKLSSRLDAGHGKDEIEQLAMTFNEMLSELEQAFRSQDEFVSNASHELRTPLAVMIAESDYVISRNMDREDYLNHISSLVKDLRKMNQHINGLLELAHLNRNNNIQFTKLSIDEPVINAVQFVKTKYPGRKISLNIEYPENADNFLINGNSELTEIALRNLIDNALKFSDNDIRINVSEKDRFIYIGIYDQGIGIPKEEIQQILKPFERGSNVRFKGGYGIGLSIVKRIMEIHECEIHITSEENVGTCFELIFKKNCSNS
jgi:two-component system, OmpR family, sensor histidine kinase ArlS